MVNSSVHKPQTTMDTRMSIASVPLTPNRPTSGWMNKK